MISTRTSPEPSSPSVVPEAKNPLSPIVDDDTGDDDDNDYDDEGHHPFDMEDGW